MAASYYVSLIDTASGDEVARTVQATDTAVEQWITEQVAKHPDLRLHPQVHVGSHAAPEVTK